ncbi:MAG: 5'-nucleotidase C-terminal domain-containing protein [Campylobacterota bacterium]|nr:5'-nucleotidase C-terminal domain-containing protein [Campylobacterota bacterium]
MNFLKIASISLALLLTFSGCNKVKSKPITLNVIHMNDIHSHLDEEPLTLNFDDVALRVDAGGYPRIATTIKELQNSYDNTLLLNAGDALQGTLYYTLFKGEVDAKMMNALPWDIFVLGNHEFDDGDENLERFLNELHVPVITANVYADDTSVLFDQWKPYTIHYYEGEAVGIIGIDTAKATKESSNPGKTIEFFNEIATAQKYIDELEAMDVNKIILLTHFGYENDRNLSLHVRGADVIVGGHSHTLMGDFESFGLSSKLAYPQESYDLDGSKVCIVQAGSFAKIVGHLEVAFDASGEVLTCKGTPHLGISNNFMIKNAQGKYEDINASLRHNVEESIAKRADVAIVEKDPELQAILESYKAKVDEKKNESIGDAKETIVHIRVPGQDYGGNSGADYPLGSDVVPIVAKAFYERVNLSDAVILNAGGVRTNINEGTISIDTAYTLLPFSNTLIMIVMRGDEIQAVLEDALSSDDGAFPYAYALRYDVDISEAKGSRISNLEIFDKNEKKYVEVVTDKTYIITTISYLAYGKDGYTSFATLKGTDTYFDYANSFVNYVKALHVKGESLQKLPAQEHCIKSYKE